MNSPTDHLTKLKQSIGEARILVRGIPKGGSVTPLQHLKVQSLIVFVHAALEEYIESLSWAVATEARRIFKDEAKITYALVALIAAKLIDDISADRARRKITGELVSNLDVFSEEAVSRLRKVIDDNNGIKERDQKNLLFPIGVNPETTDIALMNSLNAFGGDRGNIAHKFELIRNEMTLGDVEAKIKLIVEAIAKYDIAACATLGLALGVVP